jgi:hypothetical protein
MKSNLGHLHPEFPWAFHYAGKLSSVAPKALERKFFEGIYPAKFMHQWNKCVDMFF